MNPSAGVSLWRQVSETLAKEIETGRLAANQRLPPSADLAKRFAINRHTVLKALAHLQAEGLVRIERGRGSYAVVNPLEFRLGPRQWFEQNLLQSNRTPSRTIISIAEMPAPADIAKALNIRAKSKVLFVTILGEADKTPVNFGYHYFPMARLAGIKAAFEAVGDQPREDFSFSGILKSVGVSDWRRKTIRIRARLPSREEAARLKIPANEALLVTSVVSVNADNAPVVYADTCYGSGRTELVVEL